MLKTVIQKTMKEWNMVEAGDNLVVGVSGGADSVCLLLLLMELQEEMKFSLEAIHVEHGIRGEESLQDEQFVVELCEKHAIPLTRTRVDVCKYRRERGLSIEEAARELRYEAFAKIAKQKHAKVVLAHHMEDNAETILFQMLRGSGLTGLCGIRPIRTDEVDVVYLRPLLGIHRSEIEKELTERGQRYCTDSTNKELEYSRNYLRGVVLPLLGNVNDRAVEHINDMAQQLDEVRNFLVEQTDEAWEQVASWDLKGAEYKRVYLNIEALQNLHPALQKEIALKAIVTAAGCRKDITSVHVADLLALCKKQSGRELSLPYQLVAKRDFDKLVIDHVDLIVSENIWKEISQTDLQRLALTGEELEIPLQAPNEKLCIRIFPFCYENFEIPKKTYTKWLDYDNIKQGFCIRTRQNGDYFIGDATGHRKKLKEYFIDEKISAEKRGRMWLLAQDAHVLWLIGGRISENVKITEKTQMVVQIRYDGGKSHGFYKEA